MESLVFKGHEENPRYLTRQRNFAVLYVVIEIHHTFSHPRLELQDPVERGPVFVARGDL